MAEKDIAEKILANHNDVFADIVNVLLFGGKQVVAPEDLAATNDKSQYKADGKLHEQERDVSKILKRNNMTISLIGLENQTRPEKFMPARIFSYDGQSYRSQLIGKTPKRLYPAITLVLYFGSEHWNYGRHMSDLVNVPSEFAPFVSDYEMKNLFEIAFLSPEQVQLFRSDFRYVADYFVQLRTTGKYVASTDDIKHLDETMKLMDVLTGDSRFEAAVQNLPVKGGISMCDVLDRIENRGIEKGLEKGLEKGQLKGMTMVYYNKLHYSADQISKELDAPIDQIREIINDLTK